MREARNKCSVLYVLLGCCTATEQAEFDRVALAAEMNEIQKLREEQHQIMLRGQRKRAVRVAKASVSDGDTSYTMCRPGVLPV